MLQLQQLQLKVNTLLIQAHPVEIADKIGTVLKTEEQKEKEKATQVFRTGIVVAEGNQYIETKEHYPYPSGELRSTFIGETVLFMAPSVNPIDVPIEGVDQPVIINTEYLIAIIDESASSPY